MCGGVHLVYTGLKHNYLWFSFVLASDCHWALCFVSLRLCDYVCSTVMFHWWVCLCWGFTALSTQWGHADDLFVLRFYGPVNPLGSCQAQSFYVTTLFSWAGLVLQVVNQYCAHSFPRNWQLSFLNEQKDENDSRKYFMINLHERMLLTWQGLNPQAPDHQSDAHPTEPSRQASCQCRWGPICRPNIYFTQVKTGLKSQQSFYRVFQGGSSLAVPFHLALVVSYLVFDSSWLVPRLFFFVALERLCFVTVFFPGYMHFKPCHA